MIDEKLKSSPYIRMADNLPSDTQTSKKQPNLSNKMTKDASVQTDPIYETDPEYEPSEEDSEEHESDYEDEIEEDDIPLQGNPLAMGPQLFLIMQPPPPPPHEHSEDEEQPPRLKRARAEEREFVQYFTRDEKHHWKNLNEIEKNAIIEQDRLVKQKDSLGKVPLRFKLLQSPMDPMSKALILAKLDQFQQMHEGSGEYYKLRNWLNAVSRLPLGNFRPLAVLPNDPVNKIASFLQQVRQKLDDTVYGHEDTKDQMMRIMAQWISNPNSKGNCIGVHGPPGVGKTQLIKEGVCKALGLPFGFIALGGAGDGSFLEGHSFTYEGSMYGKIAEILMKTQCMNPVIFFDELDKVSSTRRGEEITGILTHLTDTSQNERYQDRYFGDIDLDLSKCLIVFSYNDESLINPILKDRMVTIEVNGYNTSEKLKIATDYLLPELFKQYNLTPSQVIFDKKIIQKIISIVPDEQGVRNLKRGLDAVISWINMQRYIPCMEETLVTFPFTIQEEHVEKYLSVMQKQNNMSKEISRMMYL